MSYTPTYTEGVEVKPMCKDCSFKTSWAFIRSCNICDSYLCNICSPICKNCKSKNK